MEVPRHWRLKQQRYALAGAVCSHCGAQNFPARPVCPQCGGVMGQNTILGRKEEHVGLAIKVSDALDVTRRRG